MNIQLAVPELVLPENYRITGRTSVFPSKASLDWFIRKHKRRLIETGALLAPTGRKLVNPVGFDAVVIEVASARASEAFQ